jgi:pyruvate ferredoxin oxidoreductase alpha subunit/2-oxoisovalerate ferredoxin oxidoreductase alpha subunit
MSRGRHQHGEGGGKMSERLLKTGCHAAALAVRSAKVDVVAAYPITPQSAVVETIAAMVEEGVMECRFLPVEGEHSAMAACAGAIAAGARVFTATASQGLLYMHETLHMVGGGRLPMVMANVNRAIFPPWALLVDHQDSLSQRDTAWMQIYVASVQEIYNAIIQGFYIAEKAQLPVMVNFDGFVLSHCASAITVPDQEVIDKFLPPYEPVWKLDPAEPSSFANVTATEYYGKHRAMLQQAQQDAKPFFYEAADRYREFTGMWEGDMLDLYRTDDAEVFVISMGSMAAEVKLSVDELRGRGIKAGAVRIRVYRPFPAEELLRVLPEGCTAIVMERNYSFGMDSGILAVELKSVLYGKKTVQIHDRIMGIAGEDLTWSYMARVIEDVINGKEATPWHPE